MKKTPILTLDQRTALYQSQHGTCPICLRPIYQPKNPEGKRAASIDHDHKTDIVRGLLCHVCNRFRVGQNTLETAVRVVEYLTKSTVVCAVDLAQL